MNFTKLSVVTVLALSSAMAGGTIEIEKKPLEVVKPATTVSGKLQGFYYTDSKTKLFNSKSSNLGTAATLDVSHKFFDGLSANFSAVGFANAMNKSVNSVPGKYMEGTASGGFMNVANLTATYGDTTLVAGRQLLSTPMLGGFDWLLAPGAFEAYTLVNKSISNLTLIGSYVNRWRVNNSGDNFVDLANKNYAFAAVYSNENLFDASVWYYNVDAGANGGYKQVYADVAVNLMGAKVQGQYVKTNYATSTVSDASAYGAKVSYSAYGVSLYGAFAQIAGNKTGFVGVDSIYTSSWNTFASTVYNTKDAATWKVDASTDIYGISSEFSYAGYGKNGSELDVILGYEANKALNLDLVYSATKANTATSTKDNALEVVATYKF